MQKSKLQFKIQNFYFFAAIFIFLFFSFGQAEAAEVFFEPQRQDLKLGQQFQIDLMIDAEGQEINAIEGEIFYPEDLLELKKIINGGSIINFWVQEPKLQNRNIVFGGIIPGGFQGVLTPYSQNYQPGKILSLIFLTKESGYGKIELKRPKVFLNDGRATPTTVTIDNLQFYVSENISSSGQEIFIPIIDSELPEEFKLQIARSNDIFDGKWFLIFAAQDKGTGIDRYETYESARKEDKIRIDAEKWTAAISPYLLKDQELKSYVYVKAIDKAGNERVAVIEPRYARWYEIWWIRSIIILLGLVAVYLVRRILWRK